MKLIIGLGNPGTEYEHTRHNIGFLFVDYLQKKYNLPSFSYESKLKADITKGNIGGETILLVKPQTYMNLSGESLSKITNFYKVEKKDFIVVYDDISMEFGKLRFREKGSAGGHNGIKDIIRFFKEDFKRIKFGIGFDERWDVSDWVLGKLTEENLIELKSHYFGKIEEITFQNI